MVILREMGMFNKDILMRSQTYVHCGIDALEFIYIRMLIIESANYLRFLKPISVILPLAITLTAYTEHESTMQVIVSYGKAK